MLRSILSSAFRRNPNLRCICTTPHLSASWVDKVKGFLTGQKTDSSQTAQSFTLLHFLEEKRRAKELGIRRRSGNSPFVVSFEKKEAILRYLGGIDPTGENIQTSHKKDAAKECDCTQRDVENTLSEFMWAKTARAKFDELQAKGKPLPTNMAEMHEVFGSTPLDIAISNLTKSGIISRNSPCICGSKKVYKRCCGKDKDKDKSS